MPHGLTDTNPRVGPPTSSQATRVCWAVVVQTTVGASSLCLINLRPTDTGKTVFQQIKREYEMITASSCKEDWISKIFTKVVVGSAEIQWILEGTKNSGQCARVHLTNEKDDLLLSEAFHHPQLLANEFTFIQDNAHFAIGSLETRHSLVGHEVLLIRRRSNKRKIAWLLVLLLVISPAVGTLVGRYTHRADVGVAVSAGIFALASFLQGFAAWLQI